MKSKLEAVLKQLLKIFSRINFYYIKNCYFCVDFQNLILMDKSSIHVGSMIKNELRKQGRSVTWLAKTIYMERSGIYKIFERKSVDVQLLIKISLALNHDFFADISRKMLSQFDSLSILYLNFQ